MTNDIKCMCILVISILIFIVTLTFNWGLREQMKELQDWKATYESGYCPTCGAYIGESTENDK